MISLYVAILVESKNCFFQVRHSLLYWMLWAINALKFRLIHSISPLNHQNFHLQFKISVPVIILLFGLCTHLNDIMHFHL